MQSPRSSASNTAGIELNVPEQLPISQKVERLQNFLGEHYFHESGMMYCMWHYRNGMARPFDESTDLGEFRYDFVNRENISHKGWLDAENSPSTSGLFLWSQAVRYSVTGDPKALAFARKAFRSLEVIFEISGKHDKPGFFGKPWGWKASDGTSPDQYICIMHGLWAFRPVASHEERARIDRILPLMADWWRNRNYMLIYFKTEWPILPHHAPAMACLHDMAYRVSGNSEYLQESRRLLTLAEGWPTWIDRNRSEMIHPKGFPIEGNGVRWPKAYRGHEYDPDRQPYLLHMVEVGEIWLTAACADYFMTQGSAETPILRHAISRHFRYGQFGLRDDFLTLMTIQVDLERDSWHPIPNCPLRQLCWGDFASRLPDLAITAHLHAPDYCPGALVLAKQILERLDNRRLHWLIDPDGQQVPAERSWTLDLLSSDVPSFTCLAYWRARAVGIDLDAPILAPISKDQ